MDDVDDVFRVTQRHGPERITTGKRIQGISVTVHCYRVGRLLIDAGPPNQAGPIVEHVTGSVDDVLITHHHPDHVGSAAALHAQGATVWAHEDALYPLWNPPEVSDRTRELWGAPERVDADGLEATMALDGRSIEVLETPGHCEDHVAIHLPEKSWVFTGDVYIGPRVALAPSEDLDQLLAAYQAICDLAPDRMFPAHGAVVEDPTKTLTKTIEHFQGLREQAWEHHDDGLSHEEIATRMFGDEGRFAQGRFTYTNMVDELLEHR